MKLFTEDAICPKCQTSWAAYCMKPRYCDGPPEHLRCTCQNCGYEWLMECADAERAEPKCNCRASKARSPHLSTCPIYRPHLTKSAEQGPGPRQYTTDEVRDRFLHKIGIQVDVHYSQTSPREPAYGPMLDLAGSILALLDGEDADLPPFVVAPQPHPAARSSRKQRKLDWYPEYAPRHNIAGSLHNRFKDLTNSVE